MICAWQIEYGYHSRPKFFQIFNKSKSKMNSSISLNKPCPCGSGKKYKRCCLLNKKDYSNDIQTGTKYNVRFNRYESPKNHYYSQFDYSSCPYIGDEPYTGRIKCRLVHMEGKSVIIPDYLFLRNGGWIQPLFFMPPVLVSKDEGKTMCDLSIDIQNGQTIKICFFNTDLLGSYSDKSQLYKCFIYGPSNIEDYACGDYIEEGGKIYLQLFHHTSDTGFDGILNSKTIWSSRWNYRGNKECKNFNFIYFTHIPEIKFPNDLTTIAMSSEGQLDYMIDSFNLPHSVPKNYREIFKDYIYTVEVYRATTHDRNCTIDFYVPVDIIDVKHIYMHRQLSTYYEVCFPYIHRIKTIPNNKANFSDQYFVENNPHIVHSEYAIVGNAQCKEGLAAPFEEDETEFIFKIEDCAPQSIHDFWVSRSNQDLFTDKPIRPAEFREVTNNPAK